MDDRIRALVKSSEWFFPPWPEIRPRTGGEDVLVSQSPGEVSARARKAIKMAMPEEGTAMIQAAVAAVSEYRFDCKMDWSGQETARNARERAGIIRRLERWVKPLREWRKTNESFQATGEESFRLGRHRFACPEDLRDLRGLTSRLVSAVDAVAEDMADEDRETKPRLGPVTDLELRRLVFRLGLAWETLTADLIAERPVVLDASKWPFLDVVDAVLEHIGVASGSGQRGARLVSELMQYHRSVRN